MKLPSFFFGVWAQPIESFPKWKAAGVNLIFPDTSNPSNYLQRRKACADLGLYYVDTPQGATTSAMIADALSMANEPFSLAINCDDEPTNQAPWYAADPVGYQKFLDNWKAKWVPVMAAVKGKKPSYINFAGGHVIAARPDALCNQIIPFAQAIDADIISCDLYPFDPDPEGSWANWNKGIGLPRASYQQPASVPDPLAVGTTIQQYAARLLKKVFPTKTIWAYIQADKFDNVGGARGPTPDEMQAQVDALLKEGLTGITAFVDNLVGPGWGNPAAASGGSNWDGETPEEFNKLKEMATKLTQTTPVVPPPSADYTALAQRVSALEAAVLNLAKHSVTDMTLTFSRGLSQG